MATVVYIDTTKKTLFRSTVSIIVHLKCIRTIWTLTVQNRRSFKFTTRTGCAYPIGLTRNRVDECHSVGPARRRDGPDVVSPLSVRGPMRSEGNRCGVVDAASAGGGEAAAAAVIIIKPIPAASRSG